MKRQRAEVMKRAVITVPDLCVMMIFCRVRSSFIGFGTQRFVHPTTHLLLPPSEQPKAFFSQTEKTEKAPKEAWFPAKGDKLTNHGQILNGIWPTAGANVLLWFNRKSSAIWWPIYTTVLPLVWELHCWWHRALVRPTASDQESWRSGREQGADERHL